MKLWKAVVALSSLGWLGCAAAPPRVPREMRVFLGLLASNSPMLVDPQEPKVERSELTVKYSFVVENAAHRRMDVHIREAALHLGNRVTKAASARCSVAGHDIEVLAVAFAARWRVDCVLRLSREDTLALRDGDEDLSLAIPVRSEEGETGALRFTYWLRLEDAT